MGSRRLSAALALALLPLTAVGATAGTDAGVPAAAAALLPPPPVPPGRLVESLDPESGPAVVPYSDAYSAVSNSPYTRHASCSGMNGSELV